MFRIWIFASVTLICSAAIADEFEGSFPAEGGPIKIWPTDGPADTGGLQIKATKGTLTSGDDPSPFQFFITGKNKKNAKEVTVGRLGGDITIQDEIVLDIHASKGAVLEGTYGKGVTPVKFKIRAVSSKKLSKETVPTWERLKKAGSKNKNQSDEYWLSRIYECRDALANSDEKQILDLARQFGTHGDDVDLNIVFGLGEYFLAQPSPDNDEKIRGIQNAVAKEQCEQFLREKETLARYYKVCLWSGKFVNRYRPQFGVQQLFKETQKGLDEKTDSPNYWWHARNALLLMYATGSENLFNEKEATELATAFAEMVKSFDNNVVSFEPDEQFRWKRSQGLPKISLPKTPFPPNASGNLKVGYFAESLGTVRVPPTK